MRKNDDTLRCGFYHLEYIGVKEKMPTCKKDGIFYFYKEISVM